MSTERPILIVDDSDDDLRLTKVLLEKTGDVGNVIALRDGDSMIEYLSGAADLGEAGLPLLILLDFKMPGFRGLELLEWIREHHAFDRVAVAILSSSEEPHDVRRAGELGAQCYFGKYPPVSNAKALVAAATEFRAGANSAHVFGVPGNLLMGRDTLPAVLGL